MNRLRAALLITFLSSYPLRNVSLGPASVTQVVLVTCYFAAILLLAVSNPKIDRRHVALGAVWILLPALFCVADVFSALIHDDPDVGGPTLKARIGAMMSFTLPILLYSRRLKIESCNRALIFSAGIAAATIVCTAFGIFDFSSFGGRINNTEFANLAGEALPRTSGILSDFGDIAILYAFVMPWMTLIPRPLMRQIALLPVFAVLLLGAFLPLSRNVWIVVAATQSLSLFFYVRMNIRRHVYKAALISLAVAVSAGVFLVYSQGIFELLLSMRAASSDARILQYEGMLRTFAERPLFGAGVDNCVFYGNPVHNAILLSICRTGLLGGIPFAALYFLNLAALGYAAMNFRLIQPQSERLAIVSIFIAYCGLFLATMLFPGGASNASEIFWGLMGLFSAISMDMLMRLPVLASRGRGRGMATAAASLGTAR